jgi:hypothetical protein
MISESIDLLDFPLLSRLRLNGEELIALSQQGTVRSEMRGTKKIFRLRFRVDGRQHVRYVRPCDAAALEAEVESLQKTVRARRNLNRVARAGRDMLRERKRSLTPLLEESGYRFHGHQIRKCQNTSR